MKQHPAAIHLWVHLDSAKDIQVPIRWHCVYVP